MAAVSTFFIPVVYMMRGGTVVINGNCSGNDNGNCSGNCNCSETMMKMVVMVAIIANV